MAEVKWSKESIEDLKAISKFIAADSPFYAKLFCERIFELVEHLQSFPDMGRRTPESNDPHVRELIYRGYRIIYQIRKDYLEIITIIHGSKLLKI
jgi:addiction module RelE/StbE family toxin